MAKSAEEKEAEARAANDGGGQGQIDEQALAEAALAEREAAIAAREAELALREKEAVTHAARLPRTRGGGFEATQQENGTFVVAIGEDVSSVDDLVAQA